jgi:plastocyanin
MPALRLIAVAVFLFLAAACGNDSTSSSNGTPPPTAASNDINIPAGASQSGQFSPNPKTVALSGGASVSIRWVNRDYSGTDYSATSVVHNIASLSNPIAFNPSGQLGGNATYSITLAAAGDYPYHCTIHPNMQGTIHVNP